MPCDPFVLRDAAGKVTAKGFICSRGRKSRPKCQVCKGLGQMRDSVYQCDGAAADHKSGTCDRHLCAQHATVVGPDRHHCPTCVASPKATEQLKLFG